MNKIRVALIGTGNMGKNHLRVIRKSPDFVLKYVVDPVFDANLFPDLGVPVLEKLEDIPNSSVDCVIIASPTETHFELVKQALEKNFHTLVEKPAASTYEQAKELVSLAKEKGLYLAVGNIERCNPVISRLQGVLRAGVIGTPVHLSALRGGAFPRSVKPGNNIFLDLAVHDLDVFRLLLGPLEILNAVAHKNILPEIYDTADIQVRNQEGITGSIQANWLSPQKVRQIKVFGTMGVCEVDYIAQTCTIYGQEISKEKMDELSPWQVLEHPFCEKFECTVLPGEPLAIQLNEWLKCLQGQASGLARNDQLVESVLLAERSIAVADSAFKAISYTGEHWQPAATGEFEHLQG